MIGQRTPGNVEQKARQTKAKKVVEVATMEQMAAMLEDYAGGLQQSFATVFDRVGQSLSQSAQMMRMMNDVMEAALLQSLRLSATYAGDAQLLVTVENRSQVLLAGATVSGRLHGVESDLFSSTLTSLSPGERHELRVSLQGVPAPIAGDIQLALVSPGTQQPLQKRCSFRVLFFQQGVFRPEGNRAEAGQPVATAASERVALERVRDLLQLSPLDGVMTADVGNYRFEPAQVEDTTFYLSVKRGADTTTFHVEVSAHGASHNAEQLRSRCQQLIRELEELSDDTMAEEASLATEVAQSDAESRMEQ